MPQVHKRVARTDIYNAGLRTRANNKQGFTTDHSLPAGDGDLLVVKKGQSYYYWKFRYGGAHYSLTPPTRNQLTQNEFTLALYDFEDELTDITADTVEELQSTRDDIASRIRELADEQDDKRSNMPDSLQDSDTGNLLEERAQGLNEWADELENIDLDDYDGEDDEELAEWLDEKINELSVISHSL